MATTSEYKKPLPTPSHVSRPFWDAAKEHRLTYQRCSACGTRVFYPRDICPGPECFGVGTLEWVEAGGLMSYAPNFTDLWRRAADFVDKILKGAKPADLPVEQPKKFEFLVNLKTAKQIGLTIPPNVLAKADRVIR
jgi:hypothetical protein